MVTGAAGDSLERALGPPPPPAAGEAFAITRAGPAAAGPAAASPAAGVTGPAGGAAPDAVVVSREDLVQALADACGAGWAFAPAPAGAGDDHDR